MGLTSCASSCDTSLAKTSPSEPSSTEERLTGRDLLSMVGEILRYSTKFVESNGRPPFTAMRMSCASAGSSVAIGVCESNARVQEVIAAKRQAGIPSTACGLH
jgi:hypothetical protein